MCNVTNTGLIFQVGGLGGRIAGWHKDTLCGAEDFSEELHGQWAS